MICQADVEGLWTWAATHRIELPAPLISCYSEDCIRLECEWPCVLGVDACVLCQAAAESRGPECVSSWGRTGPGSSLGNGVKGVLGP